MHRVVGVDVARGLAVLGMFAAHVGVATPDRGTAWLVVADGRSAALFAVLAGVSIALVTGAPAAPAGAELGLHRRRLAVRAGLLAVIGYVLVALGTPVAVILPSYAVMFVLVLPVLGAGRRALAAAAAAVLLLVPSALVAWRGLDPRTNELTDLLATGFYPALAWVGYVIAGMAAARWDLRRAATQVGLLVAGAAIAALGYGAGALALRLSPAATPYATTAPHTDTTPEMVGNTGVALAVLGLCLLAGRSTAVRTLLQPVAATGSMPLSVYSAQVVAIALAGPSVVLGQRTNGTLLAFTVVTLAACTLWRRTVGRGPLESLVRALTLGAVPDPSRAPVTPGAGQSGR